MKSPRRSKRMLMPAERAAARAALVCAVAVLLLVALPEAVAACPVCFSATEENRLAFLATTVALSLLPLGMVGGAGLWIRKKVKERDGGDDDRREP